MKYTGYIGSTSADRRKIIADLRDHIERLIRAVQDAMQRDALLSLQLPYAFVMVRNVNLCQTHIHTDVY